MQIDSTALEDTKAPIISMTYMDMFGTYGLKEFSKIAKALNGQRNLYKEIDGFLNKAREYNNITDLISAHISHNGGKNKDAASRKKAKEISERYNVEALDFIHLHCCSGGTGEFVFHGFVLKNRFEIVWIDPQHKLHK